ncbi:MAG: DUF819 family protein, partial [Bacteroidetes bacterium]|nr:DUF819 family protein [Bacteroidota bacterium]
MFLTILWIMVFLAAPAAILWICSKVKFLDIIGPVVVCYILGIIIGNVGIFPENIFEIQDMLTTLVIPLALPLIFFSMNIRGWGRKTGVVLKAFLGALIAVLIASTVTFLIFQPQIGEESWKVGGMLIGVYTGGTPNLAAIGTALDISSTQYLSVHASDVVVGGIFLLLLISVFPALFRKILPKFASKNSRDEEAVLEDNGFSVYFSGFSRSNNLLPLLKAAGLSVLIFGIGGGLSFIVPEEFSTVTAILVITTLGVAASSVKSIRKIPMTFQLGHYLLLIFSLVVSSMADIRNLADSAPVMMLYISILLIMTLFIHTIFSKITKVDADTHLIVSAALIYSPPFVPVVAAALKNKEVLMSGMVAGIA